MTDFQIKCLLLDADPLDWDSAWVFFPVLFASIGIFFTLAVFLVFVLYNRFDEEK